MKLFMQEFLKDVIDDNHEMAMEEKISANNIPVTDRSYDELSTSERENIIQILLKERHYYLKEGVHIAYGRESSLQQPVFLEEFENCKDLVSLGFEVYMLPSGCAAQNGQYKECADTITDKRLLELKHVDSPKKVGDRYQAGRHQGQDVYISIRPPISEQEALRQIFSKIRRIKEHDDSENFEGRLFLHFVETGKTIMYSINKLGVVQKRPLFGSPATE